MKKKILKELSDTLDSKWIGQGPKVHKEIKEKSRMTTKEWSTYFQGHWNFNGERQEGHIAMFPLELPKRLIKMFSFIGDTVLDPFSGSGTTCCVAKRLGRKYIGFELNEKYYKLSLGRLDRTLVDNNWIKNRIVVKDKIIIEQNWW